MYHIKNIYNSKNEKDKYETFHKILGIVFISIGVIFYITPLPGTTILIIIGFILLIGEKRTKHFLKEILGKKVFKYLKINKIIKRYNEENK